MKNKSKKKGLYLLISIAVLIAFFYFQNNSLVTSEYRVSSNDIPQSFDGYTIVQLSDLHNKSFGEDQGALIEKVKKQKPDVVVFTGDIIDSRRYDEKPALTLMEKLVQLAPVYYVTGNHEWQSGHFDTLEDNLETIGVHVMRNTAEEITIGPDSIQMIGIDDPADPEESYLEEAIMKENISTATQGIEEDDFQILLSHRPELLALYSQYGFDIVFSGHAHGGQIRIPFLGGLIAPGQGLFPEYTAGTHTSDETTLVINRGLGNSGFPLRVFNRPEIVTVTLNSVE